MTSFGRLAQFSDATLLVDALDALRDRGYTRMEVFSPYAVEGVVDRLGRPSRRIPSIMLVAGIVGVLLILAVQYVAAVMDYPIDVGGRPAASWPAFVPAAVETGILFAVVAGWLAFLRGSRLPALYQPLFDIAWFEEASRDGFLLLLRADDPAWDEARAAHDIASLQPLRHAQVMT